MNFKTSHVIVYHHQDSGNACRYAFQNISCYCLSTGTLLEYSFRKISKHLMLLFITLGGFKLKEPLIFQNISCYCLSKERGEKSMGSITFQNISCYCLSICPFLHLFHLHLFQNISCYCLSRPGTAFQNVPEFQNISCYCLSTYLARKGIIKEDFKTSHVIVYPPLLLQNVNMCRFQNISCYCLSIPQSENISPLTHFKTSHVIVYLTLLTYFSPSL